MSLTTPCQVILLSFFILADSYLFALDLFDGRDHHRIPLGLPNPFELYPGMFDPTVLPIIHKDNIKNRPYRPPFTSEITTSRIVPNDTYNKAATTDAPPTTTETDEDLQDPQDPGFERKVFLMKNAKVSEDLSVEEDKRDVPEAITLSIHEDPKLNWSVTTTPRQDSTNNFPESELETNSTNDSDLSKNSDYFVVPVTAVDPDVLNLAPNSNTRTSNNNIGLRDQNSSPAFITLDNNVNAIPSNQQNSYTNVPLVPNNNGASNNVYTLVTIPNNANQPDKFYIQPNSPQVYNLVPLNNLPTENYQPNTYTIINNQLVPVNNQPFNIVPINSLPNNYISVSNQPNSFVPVNGQPINFIPINNQPNNPLPVNNPSNNFVSLDNQPINLIPINSVPIPSNFISVNNDQPNSYGSSNNRFVPVSNIPNNVVTLNNQPNNYVPANLVPINNIPSNNQPINNGITLSSIPDDKSNIPNNYVPNNVVSLAPVGTVSYTRDQDDDESDKKDVKIESERDDD